MPMLYIANKYSTMLYKVEVAAGWRRQGSCALHAVIPGPCAFNTIKGGH